jgi:diguanylate cyclase (GGDEF)-like protein
LKIDPRALRAIPTRRASPSPHHRRTRCFWRRPRPSASSSLPSIAAESGGGNGYIIDSGHRRIKQAIAAGLEEIDVLVVEAANDNGAMRSMVENIAREALNPVDQWRAIERLVALGWTGVALALPVRQIRKLRLLANVQPPMLDHMAKGDMPNEQQLRMIASPLSTIRRRSGRSTSLTGLANRRSFDEVLERSWRQTLRQGSEMALLLLDIDYFKQFNDTYGHQAGDDCLRTVAACVSRFARRPNDLACRYGGEEFAVILGNAGPIAALVVAEEIRSAVAALGVPHEASPTSEHLTVSIGVATAVARIRGSVRMPESLLQSADHALYKAKTRGRDRVEKAVLFAPSEQK